MKELHRLSLTGNYNLFLDDIRDPINCIGYVHSFGIRPDLYTVNDWIIAINYDEFTSLIKTKGLPKIISFDHDLSDDHYGISFEDWNDYTAEQLGVEMTGMDCAKWLINYCMDNNLKLPEYHVHSMNPVGRKNIQSLLDNYSKTQNKSN